MLSPKQGFIILSLNDCIPQPPLLFAFWYQNFPPRGHVVQVPHAHFVMQVTTR